MSYSSGGSRRPVLRGELVPLDACRDLAGDWAALEREVEGSPFTSWHWVSVWLEMLPAGVRPWVFRAFDSRGIVALSLLVDAPERGAGRLFGGRSWYVHETGRASLDEITVEYGGLLAARAEQPAAYRALFETLSRSRDWRRLRIPTSAHGESIAAGLPSGMQALSVLARPCYRVDLAAVRAAPDGYVGMLGRKTRASLRQALRAYEPLGPLRVDIARDAQEALAWFDGFEELHTRHWNARGEGGCFADAFFGRFHRALVKGGAEDGFVRMTRVSAGTTPIGYLYNLRWRGTVYYYNAGLNYGLLLRNDRPGIVSLYAVVEHAAANGDHALDFLAGDQDYKRRLSTDAVMLHSIDVRPPGVRRRIERLGARLAGRPSLGESLGLALARPAVSGD